MVKVVVLLQFQAENICYKELDPGVSQEGYIAVPSSSKKFQPDCTAAPMTPEPGHDQNAPNFLHFQLPTRVYQLLLSNWRGDLFLQACWLFIWHFFRFRSYFAQGVNPSEWKICKKIVTWELCQYHCLLSKHPIRTLFSLKRYIRSPPNMHFNSWPPSTFLYSTSRQTCQRRPLESRKGFFLEPY